jgi:hypothetical protein
MPRFPSAQSKRDGPPEHEWLFADRKLLSDDETQTAYYWEFGLETADVVAEVKTMRRKTALSEKVDRTAVRKWHSENPYPGVVDSERLTEWSRRFNAQFPDYMVTTTFRNYDVHFLSSWPEFPSLHWLQIPGREIKSRAKMRHSPPRPGPLLWGEGLKGKESRGTFGTVSGVFYKGSTGLCWQEGDSELIDRIGNIGPLMKYVPAIKTPWGATTEDRWTEYRMVSLSWARSDRKLKADFAEWLKKNRPDDRQPYHRSKDSDSRRTTERDLLKALGALRLLRHFKGDWKAAADYSEPFCRDKRGNPKPLYVEQSEWRDAEKRAREALSEFHSKVFTRKVFG